jgi:hypothetical protein
MSWYIEAVGTKEKLQEHIATQDIPECGKRLMVDALGALGPNAEGHAWRIESNGHVHSCGGNASLKITQIKNLLLCLMLGIAVAALTGCGTFGKNAGPATGLEQRLFSVTTNFVPQVVQQTNTVTVTNTVQEVRQVTVTNAIGVPVDVPMTNYRTVLVTKEVPVTVTNIVPIQQLGPGSGSNTVTAVAGGVAGMFGWGGMVTTVLGGLFAGYLKLRNNALAGRATILNQTAGALTQNIETLLNVLQSTPQGAAVMPQIKNYLMAHQTEAGVIQSVAGIIEHFVNEPAAQQSAAEIVQAINTLKA